MKDGDVKMAAALAITLLGMAAISQLVSWLILG
jgi:hypothetical protein